MKSKLVPGDKGMFDVFVNGTRVFSKHASMRFPEPGEVRRLIDAA